ncbi:hypothetical protein ACFX11_014585 [Malus domestica]
MKVISQSSDARSKQQQHQPVSAPDMPQHQPAPVHVLATFWCHPWKSLGQMSDMVEKSKVDYADDASQKAKGSSKRQKVKKPGTEKAGHGDLGHQIDIPGRLIGNRGTKVTCLYTQQGKKETNQDAMLV